MMVTLLIALLSILLLETFSISPSEDLISSLPDLTWEVSYNQYSGFINLANGHNLHYWFIESSDNPSMKPVTLWLNGGPGCSSLDGLFYEQGPFHVNHSGSLYKNDYSWNKISNMLYLESPIGVGFSYSNDDSYDMNDNTTAQDNYDAIMEFFNAYSDYANNDFYIVGESYGGVYVPTLVYNIVNGNNNSSATNNETNKKQENTFINLKGFAIGNGVTNSQDQSNAKYWFANYHGFIDDQLWQSILINCCNPPYTRYTCMFSDTSNAPNPTQCQTDLQNATKIFDNGKLNPYNIYGTCFTTVQDIFYNNKQNNYLKYFTTMKIKEMDNLGQDTIMFDQLHHDLFETAATNEYLNNFKGSPPCIDSTGADIYLNRKDVQEAIHVSNVSNNIESNWTICSNILHYTRIYKNLAPFYESIFNTDSNIYGLVYNGDCDTVCDFLGDEWFVENLNYTKLNGYHEWYVNATQSYNQPQVGGWCKNYDRISFYTVRGAGHMVPQYRPEAALQLFKLFLTNSH